MAAHNHTLPRLIINADDFGRDHECTAAIAESLTRGTISATSLMANGAQFKHACELVRTRSELVGRIGVHLALDEGPALSEEMARFANSDGQLCVKRGLRRLGPALAAAIEAELSAQIERVLAAGIRPTHLDSHRHIHTSFPIGQIVVRLARRYGIPYVRPARNLAGRANPVTRTYKWMFNRYVAAHVRTANHFGDVLDFYRRPAEHSVQGVIELMIHLDDTPRGIEQQQLLNESAFRRFVERFRLVGHLEAVS